MPIEIPALFPALDAMARTAARPRTLVVDHTHVSRRHVTGVERVAIELFAADALAPHRVERVTAGSMPAMLATQQLAFLARGLRDRDARFMFAGFPPAPLSCLLGPRCLMYVHDTFPLTRPNELGGRARAYIAPAFGFALKRLRHFFVNSYATGQDVRRFVHPDALVALLRPPVRDVFGLAAAGGGAVAGGRAAGPLRVLAIGTIEPRKNYPAAIQIVRALNALGVPAELHVVGRQGWGEHRWLAHPPGFVRLHGYVADAGIRTLVADADVLLSTSKAEGLGLPLLEVQHGGLPVVAPQGEVFEEVLGGSAMLIDPGQPADAALRIRAFAQDPGRLRAARDAARANVARWNAVAADDGALFRAFLSLGAAAYQGAPQRVEALP